MNLRFAGSKGLSLDFFFDSPPAWGAWSPNYFIGPRKDVGPPFPVGFFGAMRKVQTFEMKPNFYPNFYIQPLGSSPGWDVCPVWTHPCSCFFCCWTWPADGHVKLGQGRKWWINKPTKSCTRKAGKCIFVWFLHDSMWLMLYLQAELYMCHGDGANILVASMVDKQSALHFLCSHWDDSLGQDLVSVVKWIQAIFFHYILHYVYIYIYIWIIWQVSTNDGDEACSCQVDSWKTW